MSDEQTVVCATRRTFKELADGTLRVSIDIDPPLKRVFFRLFPEPDMPVALAPLQPGLIEGEEQ